MFQGFSFSRSPTKRFCYISLTRMTRVTQWPLHVKGWEIKYFTYKWGRKTDGCWEVMIWVGIRCILFTYVFSFLSGLNWWDKCPYLVTILVSNKDWLNWNLWCWWPEIYILISSPDDLNMIWCLSFHPWLTYNSVF